MTDSTKRVGNATNYYGGVHIRQHGDRYFWSVENYSGFDWEEIPHSLFVALSDFADATPELDYEEWEVSLP